MIRIEKKFILVLALLFGLSLLNSQASDALEGKARFNVATYNIRQLNSGDDADGNGWESRRHVLSGLIRFHEFDIFGTQEGFKSQLDDLKASLPDYDYIGVAREDGKESGEHSAIFYNTDLFELLDHGDFWLSEHPETPGLGWDAACTRICSWGKFRHRSSGKIFQFFNLHLDHVGTVARKESLYLVQRKMQETGTDLPTFLTGDFNVDQYNDLYEVPASSGFLNDSFRQAGFVYALNGTYNGYETDGYTDSRIDHIFVSDKIDVIKYGILTDTYRSPIADGVTLFGGDKPAEISVTKYRSRTPSDHFPVLISVEI